MFINPAQLGELCSLITTLSVESAHSINFDSLLFNLPRFLPVLIKLMKWTFPQVRIITLFYIVYLLRAKSYEASVMTPVLAATLYVRYAALNLIFLLFLF